MKLELALDPRKVLRSPWLWDEKTIAWAEAKVRSEQAVRGKQP